MASYINRSPFAVTVTNRPDLYDEFPHSGEARALEYAAALKAKGFKPVVKQLANQIQLYFREKGYKDFVQTFASYELAQEAEKVIAAQRIQKIFVDYSSSWKNTLKDLIERYIEEECPKHKGKEAELYRLKSFLRYCDPLYTRASEAKKPKRERAKSQFIASLAFLNKPLAAVVPTDFEDYIRDRLEVVAPGTVDREIDLLAQVINVAHKTWRIRCPEHPMLGVRRPKYFNERKRRLETGEEVRLLAAARAEDRLRSIAREVEPLLVPYREEARGLPNKSARQRFLAEARAQLELEVAKSYTHVPLFETFVAFQLKTAARRGEALSLVWTDVNFEACTAYFPVTKNGHPRNVPLMKSLVSLLGTLPRTGERVFPISLDELKNAWARICSRADIKDLHIHDLRHEALSKIADTGKFTLLDLQAISGHRDPRMLLRYAHLCAKKLAERLNEAFEQEMTQTHKGRKRLKKGATVAMGEIMRDTSAVDRALKLMGRAIQALEGKEVQGPQQQLEAASIEPCVALPGNVVKLIPKSRVA